MINEFHLEPHGKHYLGTKNIMYIELWHIPAAIYWVYLRNMTTDTSDFPTVVILIQQSWKKSYTRPLWEGICPLIFSYPKLSTFLHTSRTEVCALENIYIGGTLKGHHKYNLVLYYMKSLYLY